MNPGDVWTSDGTLTRLRPAPDWSRRLEHIEELSRQHRAQIAEGFASEGEAPADLYERFRQRSRDLQGHLAVLMGEVRYEIGEASGGRGD